MTGSRDRSPTGCAVIADEPLLRFPSTGLARVPFRRGVNHVLVELRDSNDRAFTFFLDTGASFSVVTPRFLESAEAPLRGSANVQQAFGAEGAMPGSGALRELRGLQAGDLRLARAGCVELDLSAVEQQLGEPIHGILGFNVLSRLITAIDFPAGVVVFVDPAKSSVSVPWGEPAHRLPFRLRVGAMIEVTGTIEGQELPFVVDIGARATFLNGAAARLAGDAKTLVFGSLVFEEASLRTIDFPVFDKVGLGEAPAGILGNDLLGRKRLAVDYAGSRLLFWDPD